VAKGYWGRKEETERVFGARTDSGEGPFLRTGDLGVLVEDDLYVTGRIKEVIIVRGRKIYPQDIEATVQSAHDAFRLAGGAAFAVDAEDGESLVVVQEIERSALTNVGRETLVAIISDAVFKAHDLAISDIVLVKPEVVPKTSSGKIQRVLCRELYSRGELDRVLQGRSSRGTSIPERVNDVRRTPKQSSSAASTTFESTMALMNAWLVVRGLKASTDPRQTFAELGVDSMAAVELADFLQTRLRIEIDQTILYVYPTLDALARFFVSQCAAPDVDSAAMIV
jgi:acyl carrier protein